MVTSGHDHRQTVSRRRRDARGTRTVLVVEDNADARDLLTALCRSWGYRWPAWKTATTAWSILALRPYVSLVDIGLPGIDTSSADRRYRVTRMPVRTRRSVPSALNETSTM